MPYAESELVYLLTMLLRACEALAERGACHSAINAQNIILTTESQNRYRLCGVGALFHADVHAKRIYFLRPIEQVKSSKAKKQHIVTDQVFVAPEILKAWDSGQGGSALSVIRTHPHKCDLYSCA
jgi:hypothetical protein